MVKKLAPILSSERAFDSRLIGNLDPTKWSQPNREEIHEANEELIADVDPRISRDFRAVRHG
jgi:hypothetical protein